MKSETIKQQSDVRLEDVEVESPTPRKPPSYSMVDPRMMRIYLDFYRETYSSQHACLDRRTQELIAIAAQLYDVYGYSAVGLFSGIATLVAALFIMMMREPVNETLLRRQSHL